MKPTDETIKTLFQTAIGLVNKFIAIAERKEFYDKLVLSKTVEAITAREQVNLKSPYKILAKVWQLEKQNFRVVSCEQDGRVVKMLLNINRALVIAYDAKNDEVAVTKQSSKFIKL